MKRIQYLGVLFLSIFLFSCQEDFLETKPTAQVDKESATSSLDNCYAIINGIHRFMYSSWDYQDEFGESTNMIKRDMMGEDLCMTAAGNGWYNRLYQWSDHRNDLATSTEYSWKFYYRIIANANTVIDALNTKFADKKDDPFFQEIMAQALTYRAWAHFSVVQLYAQRYDPAKKGNNTQDGVILALSSEVKQRPRSTVEEVYTQINKDLDDAMALFTSSESSPAQVSDLSLHAAEAIKARVALTTGEWQTAIDFAKKAKSAGSLFKPTDFTANSGFTTIFSAYPGPGSEWIWGSQVKSDQSTYFASFFAYMSYNFSSTNIRTNPKTITKELYDAMTATDARKSIFSKDGYDIRDKAPNDVPWTALVASYETKKFRAVNAADSRGDIAYIRVAEMYLIQAEAEARLTKDVEAQATLKALMVTRDPSYTTDKVGQALIDEILLQRRIELWGEGFRFTDLKRLNIGLTRVVTAVTDPAAPYKPQVPYSKCGHIKTSYAGHHDPALCTVVTVPAGDNRWQWFIPRAELNANKLVKQND